MLGILPRANKDILQNLFQRLKWLSTTMSSFAARPMEGERLRRLLDDLLLYR